MKVLIINGPNLNLLGTREPHIYGHQTMESVLQQLKETFPSLDIAYYQSNIEGEIINKIQENNYDCLVINPGAYTHYSYAISDALKTSKTPKVEVHISNLYQREEFRQKSVTAANTNGIISGFGVNGYKLAILALLDIIK